jgi:hypothetical protein
LDHALLVVLDGAGDLGRSGISILRHMVSSGDELLSVFPRAITFWLVSAEQILEQDYKLERWRAVERARTQVELPIAQRFITAN